ncbi:hypothetical protein R3P38DRAFT_3350048 [Favolaschia claudopus]|uniref:Uncharacterized protein n=1 Tax=Favolaschia claudopus TaxID=2862362 RepID=A0AAW0CM45_9AGAR
MLPGSPTFIHGNSLALRYEIDAQKLCGSVSVTEEVVAHTFQSQGVRLGIRASETRPRTFRIGQVSAQVPHDPKFNPTLKISVGPKPHRRMIRRPSADGLQAIRLSSAVCLRSVCGRAAERRLRLQVVDRQVDFVIVGGRKLNWCYHIEVDDIRRMSTMILHPMGAVGKSRRRAQMFDEKVQAERFADHRNEAADPSRRMDD